MKKVFILSVLCFCFAYSFAQSINMQIGRGILPRSYNTSTHLQNKNLLLTASLALEYPVSKKIAIMGNLTTYYQQDEMDAFNISGTQSLALRYNLFSPELSFGMNYHYFHSKDNRWQCLIQPKLGLIIGSFMFGSVFSTDFNSNTRNDFTQINTGRDAISVSPQLAHEVRFLFTPKYYICANLWGRYSYYAGSTLTSSYAKTSLPLSAGLQVGVGYSW